MPDIARFADVPRPRCAACGLGMWLVEIIHEKNRERDTCTFECKVCGETQTVTVAARVTAR